MIPGGIQRTIALPQDQRSDRGIGVTSLEDAIGQNFYWYYTSTMADRVIEKTFIGTGAKEDSANNFAAME